MKFWYLLKWLIYQLGLQCHIFLIWTLVFTCTYITKQISSYIHIMIYIYKTNLNPFP